MSSALQIKAKNHTNSMGVPEIEMSNFRILNADPHFPAPAESF